MSLLNRIVKWRRKKWQNGPGSHAGSHAEIEFAFILQSVDFLWKLQSPKHNFTCLEDLTDQIQSNPVSHVHDNLVHVIFKHARWRPVVCVPSFLQISGYAIKPNDTCFYCVLCECVRKVKLGSFNMKDLKVENSLMTVTEFEQNGLVRRKIVFLLMRLGGQRINLQVFILNKSFSKEKGKQCSF